MASCQTWSSSSHIRHPWFDPPLMKRKQLDTVSSEEEPGSPTHTPPPSAAASEPPTKRRRCTTLERGFAHMTLGTPRVGTEVAPESVISPESSAVLLEDASVDADMATPPDITYPYYIVEEPSAPEVKMKTSSWYEPEPDRIVITDMDSFTESDDEGSASVSVNPVLLDRIRNSALESATPPLLQTTSQALVLFRPLPFVEEGEIERLKQERRKRTETELEERQKEQKRRRVDEDAMDIEP